MIATGSETLGSRPGVVHDPALDGEETALDSAASPPGSWPAPVPVRDRPTSDHTAPQPPTTPTATALDVDAVHVVVPAHDEELLVGGCLVSVLEAAVELRRRHPRVLVDVVVVLDRCTDGTAAVVAELAAGRGSGPAEPVVALDVDAGSVGAARRRGLDHVTALDAAAGFDPARVWICNTDADCMVPPDWLVDHVSLARGHDLVQGEVRPVESDLTPVALGVWDERHPAGRGSLHGANLGFRLAAYLAVGGFVEVADQEDLLLVRAMKARGASSVGGTRVLTSGRRESRVPGGFAGYLRGLDDELAAQAADLAADPAADAQADGSGSTPSDPSTSSSTSRST
jgi:hypothetical protein